MYDLVTLEPEDRVVMTAVNAIVGGQGAIPGPNGNYRFFAVNDVVVEGDGGAASHTLVVVAHGSDNKLSGHRTWAAYRQAVQGAVDWSNANRVYLAACSVGGDNGNAFVHGNIANEVKSSFPNATVWASKSNVSSRTQSGDWQML
jgi:hypothetical protein